MEIMRKSTQDGTRSWVELQETVSELIKRQFEGEKAGFEEIKQQTEACMAALGTTIQSTTTSMEENLLPLLKGGRQSGLRFRERIRLERTSHRFSYSRQILIVWLGDQDMSWLCGLSGVASQLAFCKPRQNVKTNLLLARHFVKTIFLLSRHFV